MAERVAEEQLKPMAQKVADNAEPMAKDATAQYVRQPAKQLAEQVSEWSSQCPNGLQEGRSACSSLSPSFLGVQQVQPCAPQLCTICILPQAEPGCRGRRRM